MLYSQTVNIRSGALVTRRHITTHHAMGRRKERAVRPVSVAAPTAPPPASWIWALMLILIAAGATYVYQRARFKSHESQTGWVVQYVPREELGDKSYREVAELRTPLILTGTVADKWQARKTFTTKFLAQKLPFVMAHRQEEKRSFMTFHDNKPLEPLVNERWEDFNVKVNVTLPQVLAWGEGNSNRANGPFLYFSQDITTLRSHFPEIMDHIQPLQDLILSPDDVQVNLWIGRSGIVTHTHYDCTFNFFLQLQGRKRFTLFPPNSSLYLYPCLHPHYGHSQVQDIYEPNTSSFPKFSWDGASVAEVGAGDMLVVPPFWYHNVETLEESVSVNTWSGAPEYTLVNKIYEQPIPFEDDWSWEIKAKATKIYVEMLLRSLAVDIDFITELLDQRYRPVVVSGNLIVSEKAVNRTRAFCSQVDWPNETQRLSAALTRGTDLLQPLFALITPRATMEICLGNYIEHLLHLTVGLEHVYPFLESCF